MGNFCFRRTPDRKPSDENLVKEPIVNEDDVFANIGPKESPEEIEEKARLLSYDALKYDLQYRQHLFILNNVFLAVQFFKNYEKEKKEIEMMKDARDREVTKKLTSIHKSCYYTGSIFEQVENHTRLRKRNEAYGKYIAPAMEYHINYDNVKILQRHESPTDFKHGASALQFKMDTNTEEFQQGEVHLCLERGNDLRSNNYGGSRVSIGYDSPDNIGSTTTTDATVDSRNRRRRKRRRKKPQLENLDVISSGTTDLSSSSSDEQEEAESSTLFPILAKSPWANRKRSTMKKAKSESHLTVNNESNGGSTIDSGIRSFPDTNASLPDLNNSQTMTSELRGCLKSEKRHLQEDARISSTLNVSLLSSSALARKFTMNFEDIALLLGDKNLAYNHTSRYHMVNYEKHIHGNAAHYRFLPSITVPFWPDEYIEWIMRERVPTRDVRLNQVYVWPTKAMVEKAMHLGCNLIPKLPNSSSNPSATHSWMMNFTKIEAFLMRTLLHSQIRCYLFCIVLYKMYLEDMKAPLVSAHHIRHILFKMCEEEFLQWPEEQLAEKIFQLMETLHRALQKQRLPNYFIRKRNILENIPTQQILRSQKRVSEMLESWPIRIFHILEALSSIELAPGFYPRFPFEKLNYYLTAESWTIIKHLPLMESSGEQPQNILSSDDDSEENVRIGGARGGVKHKRQYMKNKQIIQEKAGINFNAKIWHLDRIRLNSILPLFIEHFIAMGKKSNEFGDRGQALLYLNHAENLAKLMEEECNDVDKTKKYKDDIRQLRGASRSGSGDRSRTYNLIWKQETKMTRLSFKNDQVVFRTRQKQEKNSNPKLPDQPQPTSRPNSLNLNSSRMGLAKSLTSIPSINSYYKVDESDSSHSDDNLSENEGKGNHQVQVHADVHPENASMSHAPDSSHLGAANVRHIYGSQMYPIKEDDSEKSYEEIQKPVVDNVQVQFKSAQRGSLNTKTQGGKNLGKEVQQDKLFPRQHRYTSSSVISGHPGIPEPPGGSTSDSDEVTAL
ncbi:unnamed protein product [Darwinula stevensoni]|uniref:Mab-21-like HhH/H2TH-like domain-containing protein n=1 Tax=Darwinula stevensoni TaxID=69355 RepID=A0A7R9A2B8_9CRUS|nr:unnamed protein product [Darwinula stevensoni]CAG0879599.1 unnamed protein product [Darwinula stevensoni]